MMRAGPRLWLLTWLPRPCTFLLRFRPRGQSSQATTPLAGHCSLLHRLDLQSSVPLTALQLLFLLRLLLLGLQSSFQASPLIHFYSRKGQAQDQGLGCQDIQQQGHVFKDLKGERQAGRSSTDVDGVLVPTSATVTEHLQCFKPRLDS